VSVTDVARALDGVDLARLERARWFAGKGRGIHSLHLADALPVPGLPDAYLLHPLPPIMVGGMGERYLLRVVAQHADWWNYGFTDPPTYAHNQEVLKQHCRDVGRDYDEIKQVVRVGILIAETERDIRRLQQQPDIRSLDDGVIGTPEQVAEALLGIIGQGADRLTVHFADAPRLEGTQLFAASVLPLL